MGPCRRHTLAAPNVQICGSLAVQVPGAAAFLGTCGVAAGLATRSPVVLVLEDLHWADESSRELLAFLAVRLRDQPVMLVGTLREEELAGSVGQWLAELERRPQVTRLRLGGWPTARSPSW
jgi:hypothetical protein